MTEKDYNPERRNKKVLVETPKQQTISQPQQKKEQSADKKISEPAEEAKVSEKKEEEKPVQKKPVVKKTEAIVNGKDLPISTKESMAICRFIKNKKIKDAIADLEQVVVGKKAVPMKGEIPHRKGKIMAGRFPKKAAEHFINLLKTLAANANVNGLEEPIIVECVANNASRPYGRFGRVRKKRTHIKIKCKEKMKWKKEK